jgi:hypothetical protein
MKVELPCRFYRATKQEKLLVRRAPALTPLQSSYLLASAQAGLPKQFRPSGVVLVRTLHIVLPHDRYRAGMFDLHQQR